MKNPVSVVVANEDYPVDMETRCPWIPCGTTAVFITELAILGLKVSVPACSNHLAQIKRKIFESLELETATKEGNS